MEPHTFFLGASVEERVSLVLADQNREKLTALLGADAYAQYRSLAKARPPHLGGPITNVVFLPGIMGSVLTSQSRGGVWWIDARTRSYIDKLRLSPDGRNDFDVSNKIVATTTDIAYDPFLCAILERDDFGHNVFPYDWRKPLDASTAALCNVIRAIYEENGHNAVHVVAHSMGGLVLRSMLANYGKELNPILGKIVFIATPHYGSPAMASYLKNHLWGFDLMALLGLFLSRKTFRSFWGALSLLPAPVGVYPGTRAGDVNQRHGQTGDAYLHPCANFDMYDIDAWSLDLEADERASLKIALAAVHDEYFKLLESHQKATFRELRGRMLAIVGVGYDTLFQLRFDKSFWGLWEHTEKITSRIKGDPNRDGDGTVPVASAALEGVTVRYARGRHGELPNIPSVIAEVFRWLKDEPLELDESPEGALSKHLGAREQSIAPALDEAGMLDASNGRWNATQDPAKVQAMCEELAAGKLPEFTRVKLL